MAVVLVIKFRTTTICIRVRSIETTRANKCRVVIRIVNLWQVKERLLRLLMEDECRMIVDLISRFDTF